MLDTLLRNKLKVASLSTMLIRTYLGLTPNLLPPRVDMLCPLKKLSQSSTESSSHFSHAKAAKNFQLITHKLHLFVIIKVVCGIYHFTRLRLRLLLMEMAVPRCKVRQTKHAAITHRCLKLPPPLGQKVVAGLKEELP